MIGTTAPSLSAIAPQAPTASEESAVGVGPGMGLAAAALMYSAAPAPMSATPMLE